MKKWLLYIILLPLWGFSQSGADELVNVRELIPDIVLDLRYNTTNNFIGEKLYSTDECFLSHIVVERLILVQDSLRNIRLHDNIAYPQGLGLKIWDGYRPRAVQYLMWDILPDPRFVANPEFGSSHNRGAAVDVTLVDNATGEELPMPTDFDDFSDQAGHNYTNLPANIIANRLLLRNLMVDVGGFSLLNTEWWHYSYGPARVYPLLDFQMK